MIGLRPASLEGKVASRKELIEKRRKVLLNKGYPPGIVNLAMDWAVGCAEGMATYASRSGNPEDSEEDLEALANQFLPTYLRDCEKWIQSFGHEPKIA